MAGWPRGKPSTMSQTHSGSGLRANRLRIRIRVGSARALNQEAYVSASRSPTDAVTDTGGQHRRSIVAVGRSRVVVTIIVLLPARRLLDTSTFVNISDDRCRQHPSAGFQIASEIVAQAGFGSDRGGHARDVIGDSAKLDRHRFAGRGGQQDPAGARVAVLRLADRAGVDEADARD